MTQVFDEETGSLTPVTVIQAGPCPVVAVRTSDADGYDAVQLAFDEVPNDLLSVAVSVFRRASSTNVASIAQQPTAPDDRSYDRCQV